MRTGILTGFGWRRIGNRKGTGCLTHHVSGRREFASATAAGIENGSYGVTGEWQHQF